MATLPESPVFELLLQSALAKYEKETGKPLVENPLMAQLNRCDTVEAITQALQERAQAFREFRGGHHKAITLLNRTVQALHKLSGAASLVESIGLVCRKGSFRFLESFLTHFLQSVPIVNTIHTCIGVFLSVCIPTVLVGESL